MLRARSKQYLLNSQLSVDIESFIGLDFHLPYAVARGHALSFVNGRLEFIAPRAPPAVTIAVIVAAKEVSLRF